LGLSYLCYFIFLHWLWCLLYSLNTGHLKRGEGFKKKKGERERFVRMNKAKKWRVYVSMVVGGNGEDGSRISIHGRSKWIAMSLLVWREFRSLWGLCEIVLFSLNPRENMGREGCEVLCLSWKIK